MKKFTNIKESVVYDKSLKLTTNNDKLNEDSNIIKTDIAKFVSKLLESREMSQIYHWSVKGEEGSHASHIAFEEYYNSIIIHIDNFVEIYQGQYEIIEGYTILDKIDNKLDYIKYFEGIADYIKINRVCVKEVDTHLHSIIDDMLCVIYKTLYKLKYNR